jgi:hypothetical protein
VTIGASLLGLGALPFAHAGVADDAVRAAPVTPPAPGTHVAAAPVRVAGRADALTFAGGRVWVLSSASGRLDVLDAVTGRRRDRLRIGASARGADIAAGFGAVWAVSGAAKTLVRIGTGAGHGHVDAPIRLAVAGTPDRLAVGRRAVWVAAREPGGGGEAIARVDRRTHAQRLVAVPGGTRAIAADASGVWVTNARRRTVTHIDDDLARRTTIPVDLAAGAIAVTRSAVWITSGPDWAVVRIDRASKEHVLAWLDDRPRRIAVGRGSLWVLERTSIVRLDPVTLRERDAIPTPDGAKALVLAGSRGLWLALSRADAAQRIAVSS